MIQPTQLICGHGGHYSIYHAHEGMALLRTVFPEGSANDLNVCLFSTSGVHGTYQTIEEEEAERGVGVTFLVIQPRIVTLTYGVCYPREPADFDFLKRLRQSSFDQICQIGTSERTIT